MSTQQHLSIVAEYKICAILKYYNDNVIKKNQLDELMNSNKRHKIGLYRFIVLINRVSIINKYIIF